MYICWYAFGRFFIEGLRSDSLMLGNFKISQLVATVLFISAGVLLINKRKKAKIEAFESSHSYNPLFEETSKAVQSEVAEDEKFEEETVDTKDAEETEDNNVSEVEQKSEDNN
jgi:phosphatidylglycerol:prolipoprotein diacylglycerol transferase